jgi:hypothetical protein
MRAAAGILLCAAGALSSASSSPAASWAECHCDWLEKEARALAGVDAVDCGFVNLLEDSSRARLHAGMRCARRAFKDGKPFLYASFRIPIDSYAHEVLIHSAEGTLWLLTVDRMIDEETAQFWKQKCQKLRFKMHNAGFVIEGCETGESPAP